MKPSSRTLESAGWYALAFMITQLLHELAHALAGMALGRAPILHTSFVDYVIEGSSSAQLWSAAAGPLFSLVQGIVLTIVVRRGPASPRLRLLLTWLAFHGSTNFIGYLFSTSFAPGADLGRIAGLAGLPFIATLGLTGLGYAGLRLLVRPLAPSFAALAGDLPDEASARAWASEVGILAGAMATPVLLVAALPVPHWLPLLYIVAAFLPLLDLPKALDRSRGQAGTTPLPAPSPLLSIGAWLALVVVARLLLDGGIALAP